MTAVFELDNNTFPSSVGSADYGTGTPGQDIPNLLRPDSGVDQEDNLTWELASKYLVGIFLSLVIFSSIVGNFLVCLAIYTDRRLRKLSNLFLASLALADLFVAALVESFALANDMMGYWVFGSQFCETWIAFDVMGCTSSILNLCAISLDRFIHIKDPLRYGRWMTKRVVISSIAAIWLLSALVSFLPISLGWHKPKKSGQGNSPEEIQDFPGSSGSELPSCAMDLTPTYAVVSSSISFFVPCVVMVALYTRLYLYARKHVKNIRAVTKMNYTAAAANPNATRQVSSNGKVVTLVKMAKNANNHVSHHVMDHKAAITLGVIMGTFLICWVPFFCMNITAAFCKSCVSDTTFKGLTWLGYLNSALNPVIYSIFNTEFREAFKRILVTYVRGECCASWEHPWCRGRHDSLDRRKRSSASPALDAKSGATWNKRPISPIHSETALKIEAPGESSGGGTEI